MTDEETMAIFLGNPGKLVPECIYSGFHWS